MSHIQTKLDIEHAPELMDARFWMHAQFPRNTAALTVVDAEATAVGACGDAIHICLRIENDHISGVQAIPDGCVYTVACASAVSVLTLGAALEEAVEILPDQVATELGGLPEDHLHCARLAVNTVGEAIADYYQRQRHRPAEPTSAPPPVHSLEGGH